MNCKSFMDMTPIEKSNYIGKLVHAVTNSQELFHEGEKIIRKATSRGLFASVTINPPTQAPIVNDIDNVLN